MKTDAQQLADLQRVASSARGYGANPNKIKLARELASEGPTTILWFPKRVELTLPDYTRIIFEKGPQPVPNNLSASEKEYLELNGVTEYKPKQGDLKSVIPVQPDPAKVADAIAYVMDKTGLSEADAKKIVDEQGAAVILAAKLLDLPKPSMQGSESYAEMQARVEGEKVSGHAPAIPITPAPATPASVDSPPPVGATDVRDPDAGKAKGKAKGSPSS